jgi:hypothetical protein
MNPVLASTVIYKAILKRRSARPSPPRRHAATSPAGKHLDAVAATRVDDLEGGDLLPLRLEALGIDPVALRRTAAAEFRRLAAVCGYCLYRNRCERDLAAAFAGEPDAAWRDYCPNAFTLDPPDWAIEQTPRPR